MTATHDAPAAIILAAGLGTRLRPLTDLLPKALCPVNDRALVDWALDAVTPYSVDVAVNVHAGRDAMLTHLGGRGVHVSVEVDAPRGTAGGVGTLRGWVDGRAALVVNADAWRAGTLRDLVDGWDGERVRLLCVRDAARGDFGDIRYAGACLLPWSAVAGLSPEPSGLYEVLWRDEERAGRLDLVVTDDVFVDCVTPADYLRANLVASGGRSVVGRGAFVEGEVVRSVVWAGSRVRRGERLVDAIRAGALTVQT
jgi:NDP-sugar pyrophosphorylase family protein